MISFCGVGAVAAGPTTLVNGFTGPVNTNHGDSGRLNSQFDGIAGSASAMWYAKNPTDWSVTGGLLCNAGASGGNTSDGMVATMLDLASIGGLCGNLVTVSFDYNVAAGDQMYFHLRAADDDDLDFNWDINLSAQGGNAWNASLDGNAGNGTSYNLLTGAVIPLTGAAGGVGEAVCLTGMGTYTRTIDMSGYAFSNIADYEWLVAGFAAEANNGLSKIDDFLLSAAPGAPGCGAPDVEWLASTYDNDGTWESTVTPNAAMRWVGSGTLVNGTANCGRISAWINRPVFTLNDGNGESFDEYPGDPTDDDATWEFVFRPGDYSGRHLIFESGGTGDGAALLLTGSMLEFRAQDFDSLGRRITTSVDLASLGISPSDFVHMAVTLDIDSSNPGTGTMYINGVQVDTMTTTGTVNDWSGTDVAGLGRPVGGFAGSQPTGRTPFDGDIAEIRLYEGLCTSAGIAEMAEAVGCCEFVMYPPTVDLGCIPNPTLAPPLELTYAPDGAVVTFVATQAPSRAVWVNEFHYDNAGADMDEMVEVMGIAGTSLAGWTIQQVNGANGRPIGAALALPGTIPDQRCGVGTVSIDVAGMQNGPDGFALVDPNGIVVQFLSYEGSFTAVGTDAAGLMSMDVGVLENGAPVGETLQLTGAATSPGGFTWVPPMPGTRDGINTGQQICFTALDRVYDITTDCNTIRVTQTVYYVENAGTPQITTLLFEDFGCAGDMRSVMVSSNGLMITDSDCDESVLSTQLVSEVRTTNDCRVTVERTWSAEDCCGNVGQAVERYAYSMDDEEIMNTILPDLDLGCIANTNAIPPPDFIAAGTMASCGDVKIQFMGKVPGPSGGDPVTTVGVFTGGDAGEGLDLDGEFVYAVALRDPAGITIRDADFVTLANEPGVSVVAANNILNWQQPNFGNSLNDDKLEKITRSIRWASRGTPYNVDLNVTPGCRYKAQLIIYDTTGNRGFDFYAEGVQILDDQAVTVNPNGTVVTFEYTAQDAVLNFELGQTPSAGLNWDAVLNAVTLERIPACGEFCERVYEITSACQTALVTQRINWVVDNGPPVLSVAPHMDFGCAGDMRLIQDPTCPDPTYGGTAAFSVMDPDGVCTLTKPELVEETRVVAGCTVTVSRKWRVEDCCHVVEETETYTYENLVPRVPAVVRVMDNVSGVPLNIAEIEILDSTGANIAPAGTASASGSGSGTNPSGVNDLVFPNACCGGLWHSNNQNGEYVQIDLAAPSMITEIAVTPRRNCCPRLSNFDVILYDADGEEIWRETRTNPACGDGNCAVDDGYITQRFFPPALYEPQLPEDCFIPGLDLGCIDSLDDIPPPDLSCIASCGPISVRLVRTNCTTNSPDGFTTTNALRHYGFHVNNDSFLNFDGNGGLVNGLDPTGHPNFNAKTFLTDGPGNRGLDFNNDGDFMNSGAIGVFDNYMNLWMGTLCVSDDPAANNAPGVWTFRDAVDDDRGILWIDLDMDGVFESNTGTLGTGGNENGEQISWENTQSHDITLGPGKYLVAFGHREGGGGSQMDIRVSTPNLAEEVIKPTDPDQDGFWSVLEGKDCELIVPRSLDTKCEKRLERVYRLETNCATTECSQVVIYCLNTGGPQITQGPPSEDYGCVLDGSPRPIPPKTFDFDPMMGGDIGTDLQGWTDTLGTSYPAHTMFNGSPGGRGTGGFANGPSSNQDSAHPSLIMSSPPFQLCMGSEIEFFLSGGQGGNLPTNISQIPASSSGGGAQGVGLRRLSDGEYLVTGRRPGNGIPYVPVMWDATVLDPINDANPGAYYVLDFFDYYNGSWGFSAIDDVSIAGIGIADDPTYGGQFGFAASDADAKMLTTTLVSQVEQMIECDTLITRTWEVRDCCGEVDTFQESFSYRKTPQKLLTELLPPLDAGCVESVLQIPPPDTTVIGSFIECGEISYSFKRNQELSDPSILEACEQGFERVYSADAPCLPAGTDPASWNFVGTLDGWTLINGEVEFEGTGIRADESLTVGGFPEDRQHENTLLISPAFCFDGSTLASGNAVEAVFEGGAGDQNGFGAVYNTPQDVLNFNGGISSPAGQKGIGLYDVSAGMYVHHFFDSANGGAAETVGLTPAQLTALGISTNGVYELHFYETDEGSWGWTQLNSARAAGLQKMEMCVTQVVTYTIDSASPQIVEVAPHIDYGCAGDLRPVDPANPDPTYGGAFPFRVEDEDAIRTGSIPGFTFIGVYNGNSYYYSDEFADTWETAYLSAQALGGYLVTLTSAGENAFVESAVPSDFYMGLTDDAAYGTSEGNWIWITGEPFGLNGLGPSYYQNWDDNLPNGGNFGVVNVNDGQWDDFGGNEDLRFVVEFEGNDLLVSTQLVMEARVEKDCRVEVRRTWRVEDCCGNWHEKMETYCYSETATTLARQLVAPTTHVGCVASLNAISHLPGCQQKPTGNIYCDEQMGTYPVCTPGVTQVGNLEVTQTVSNPGGNGTFVAPGGSCINQFDRPVDITLRLSNLDNSNEELAISPPPDIIVSQDSDHLVVTNGLVFLVREDGVAAAGDATVVRWTNAMWISIAGLGDGPNRQVEVDALSFDDRYTELQDDCSGTLSYIDEAGMPASLPGTASLCDTEATCFLGIMQVRTQACAMVLDPCTQCFERVFMMSTRCETQVYTQVVTYALDTGPPVISVPPFTDNGCVGDPRPIPMTNLITVVDPDGNDTIISTQLVMETRITNNCQVTVDRFWRAVDCCGNWHEKVETYVYTEDPGPGLAIFPDVEGCYSSVSNIPMPAYAGGDCGGRLTLLGTQPNPDDPKGDPCRTCVDRIFELGSACPAPGNGTIDWDMCNGLNGWTVISGTPRIRPGNGCGLAAAEEIPGGFGFPEDNPHTNALFISPTFEFSGGTLGSGNWIELEMYGGAGNQDNLPPPANPTEVCAFNDGLTSLNGQKGIAIYDVATGQYVAHFFKTANGGTEVIGSTGPFPVGTAFQLHYYETDFGGWGWNQINEVRIAGGALNVATQTACYVIDTGPPTLEVLPFEDFGCMGDLRPVNVSSNGVVTNDPDGLVTLTLMSEHRTVSDCVVVVTRSWMLEDCCGNIVTKDEVYQYTQPLMRWTDHAQTLAGDAVAIDDDCTQLTDDVNFQAGAAWVNTPADLTQPFSFSYEVNFGAKDETGADGMAFVLQKAGTSAVGGAGFNLGIPGGSFGVAFDNWELNPDEAYLFANNSGTVLAPGRVNASASGVNIEDGQPHGVTLTWDPATMTFEMYFDGVLRLSTVRDIVNTDLSGCTEVTFGWTGGTGASNNRQTICIESLYKGIQALECPATNFVGCIASIQQLPVPSALLLDFTNTCDITVEWLGDSNLRPGTNACEQILDRVYAITDPCGNSNVCTQAMVFVLDTAAPILTPPPSVDNGCLGDPRPIPMTNMVMATDADGDATIVRTQMVREVRITNSCEVTVTRTWRVEDCCGRWHEADEVYAYSLGGRAELTLTLADIDLDCIANTNQFPAPSSLLLGATSACTLAVNWQGDGNLRAGVGCTQLVDRVYQVADNCGGTQMYTQEISFVIDTAGPIVVPPPLVNNGCAGDPRPVPTTNLVMVTDPDGDDTVVSIQMVEEVRITNHCQVTVTRLWRAIDCCGNTHDATETYTFIQPDPLTDPGAIPVLDLGCIGGTNNLPSPSALALGGVTGCSDIQFMGDMNLRLGTGCEMIVDRVYELSTPCASVLATQELVFVVETGPPVITTVAPFADFGCAGDLRSVAMSSNAIVAVDPDGASTILSTQLVREVRVTNGCDVTVSRTWRVTDCCDNLHEATETYGFTLGGGEELKLSDLPDLVLGCIANTDAIPNPDFSGFSTPCGPLAVSFVRTQALATVAAECQEGFDRVYEVASSCTNGFVTQSVLYVLEPDGLSLTAPPDTYIGCLDAELVVATPPGSGNLYTNLMPVGFAALFEGVFLQDFQFAGALGTNFVTNTTWTGCSDAEVEVTAEIVDCCGDRRSATTSYFFTPLNFIQLDWDGGSDTATLDLGCVESEASVLDPLTLAPTATRTILQQRRSIPGLGVPLVSESVCPAVVRYRDSSSTNPVPGTACEMVFTNFFEAFLCPDTTTPAAVYNQIVRFTVDPGPPQVTRIGQGGSLDCVPDGRSFEDHVALLAPLADDLASVTATGGCADCTLVIEHWQDEYYTDDICQAALVRVFQISDCCGNRVLAPIRYTFNDQPPVITSVEPGGYVGCQVAPYSPPTNLAFFAVGGSSVLSTSITEFASTNDQTCVVTLDRTYRVTSCCGLFDEVTTTFTYTREPDLIAGALSKLDLGCIVSPNQIPPVDLTMLNASSECAIVSIDFISASPAATNGCVISNERVFEVETLCGVTSRVTQDVCWVLNATRPEIVETETGSNHLCQAGDFVPPGFVVHVNATNAPGTAEITDLRTTNGCEVTVLRIYRVSDCCDEFDRREVTHTFTVQPGPLSVDALANVDLGCIADADQVPPPSALLLDASSSCSVVDIEFLQDSIVGVGDCTTAIERVYRATDLCANTVDVTQRITYVLNTQAPRIDDVLAYQHYGCQANDPRSEADSRAGLVTSDDGPWITTQLVTTVTVVENCKVTVVRSWRIEDCCGLFDIRNEVYEYELIPDAVVFTDELDDLDFGCVAEAIQIPPPTPSVLKAEARIGATTNDCPVLVMFVGDTELGSSTNGCTTTVERVYMATNNCGVVAFSTQLITYVLNELPRILQTPPDIDYGCMVPAILPDPWGGFVGENFIMSNVVTNVFATNSCEVILERLYTIENCCGFTDEAVTRYTWIDDPGAPTLDGITEIDLGCISSEGLIPPPNPALFRSSSACESSVRFAGQTAPRVTSDCDWELSYLFESESVCGDVSSITQRVTWILDLPPEILKTEVGTHLGCQVAGYLPPTNLSPSVFCVTNVPFPFEALDLEQCVGDFTGVGNGVLVIPELPTQVITKAYDFVAGDIPFTAAPVDPDDAFPPGLLPDGNRVEVGDVCSGPTPGSFVAIGNMGLQAITNAAVASFVGSDQAICLDGVDDSLSGPSIETGGSPRIDQNAGGFRLCFSPDSLSNPDVQVLFESGGAVDGLALWLSASILSFTVQNGAASGTASVDLMELSPVAGDYLCATASWDPVEDEISLSVVDLAGNAVSCCARFAFTDTMDADPATIGGAGDSLLVGPPTFFAGKVASLRVFNGYGRGQDPTTASYCANLDAVGCGAVVLHPNCPDCGVADVGSYQTVIEACPNLFGWVNLEIDSRVPTDGSLLVTITDGSSTIGPQPVTPEIDLSNLSNLATNLSLTFDFAYTGTDVCESPALFGWTAHFLCGTETNIPLLSITDTLYTNGCDITVRRNYRVENCCGRFDEHDEEYSYTEIPDLFLGDIPKLDMGCIDSIQHIAQPNLTVLAYTATCGVVRMDFVSESAPQQDRCTGRLERVYEIEDPCGQIRRATQEVCWVLAEQPEITAAEPGQYWGCQAAGYVPPGNVTATGYLTLTTNVITTIVDCTAFVRRTYRAEDCCGNFDRWDVEHSFTIRPGGVSVAALDDLEIGCVTHSNLIPQANATLIAASSSCSVVSIQWLGDAAPVALEDCEERFERVYQVTDRCGQMGTVTQMLRYTVDTQAPTIDTVPPFQDYGCQGSDPRPADPMAIVASDDHPDSLTVRLLASVTNLVDCRYVVNRTWRVEDCCGKTDTRLESYAYSRIGEVMIPPLPSVDLGCLNDMAQVPPPTPSAINATADGCDVVTRHLGDTLIQTGCLHRVTRVYEARNECGSTAVITQELRFVLDVSDPKFVSNPGGDLGCSSELLPTIEEDLVFFTDGGVTDNCAVVVFSLGETIASNGCLTTATRDYMAMDNCGNTEVDSVVYRWYSQPDPPRLSGPAFVDVGCVNSVNQLPAPTPFAINADIDCVLLRLVWTGDGPHAPAADGEVCLFEFDRVYEAEDLCGQISTFTQTIHYALTTEPEILSYFEGRDLGCVPGGEPTANQLPAWGRGLIYNDGIFTASSTDTRVTNGCEVVLTRAWRVENCCGAFDTAQTEYRWTITPSAPMLLGDLDLDLGCITAIDQIPVPATSQFTPVAGCGATIRYLGSSPTNEVSNCENQFTRLYEIVDECGGRNQFAQTIRYVLNSVPVRITSTESGANFGCLSTPPVLPAARNSVTFEGEASGLFVTETTVTNGCTQRLTREYVIEDCCGNFDRATVEWSWTTPAAAPNIIGASEIDLGCITDTGGIPQPSTSQFSLEANCGGQIRFVSEANPIRESECEWSLTRVYEASDGCGQSIAFEQVLRWSIFSIPNILSVPPGQDFGCQATDPVPAPDFSAVVISGSALETNVTDVVVTNGCTATKTRTWELVSCCGDRDQMTATYTWRPFQMEPEISGPETLDLGCIPNDRLVPIPNPAAFTLTSGCGGEVTFVGESTPVTSGCLIRFERLYRGTDSCGQVVDLVQSVSYSLSEDRATIVSVEPPFDFGCSLGNPVMPPDFGSLVASGEIIRQDVADRILSNGCERTLTRRYEIEDCCGHVDSETVNFTWTEQPSPAVIDGPVTLDLGCIGSDAQVPPPALSLFTVTSECGAELAFVRDSTPALNGCLSTVTRLYRATDSCGQQSDFVQTITYSLGSTEPEILDGPVDQDFGCSPVNPVPAADFSLLEVAGDVLSQTVLDTLRTNGCQITFRRTYRVADCCGAADSFRVTYRWTQDDVAPVITPLPGYQSEVHLGCNPGFANLPPLEMDLLSVADDCGTPGVEYFGFSVESNGCSGTVFRHFRSVDDCGNEGRYTQRVHFVVDEEAPQMEILPTVIDLGCAPVTLPAPTDGIVQIDHVCGAPVSTNLMEETMTNSGCLVVITRLFKVTDACGNEGTASQRLTYRNDQTSPAITCPPDVNLGCTPPAIPAPNPADVFVDTECTSANVVHEGDLLETNGCEVTLTRTYSATDSCGRRTECLQRIYWNLDGDAPRLVDAPLGGDLGCGEAIPAPNPGSFVVEDGCSGSGANGMIVSVDYVITNQQDCLERVAQGYRIEDACGNFVLKEVEWTRSIDTEAPVLACLDPAPIGIDPNCQAVVPGLSPTVLDNCSLLTVVQSPTAGTTVVGPTNLPITLTAVDACGNQAQCMVMLVITGRCTAGLVADIDLRKTVYAGHDQGAGCAGAGEKLTHTNGADITWCFEVRNTGELDLYNVLLRDDQLNPVVVRNIASTLAVGESIMVWEERLLTGALVNQATVMGTPPPEAGGALRPDVFDTDTASVEAVHAALRLTKTVAHGHDAACPGDKLVEGVAGSPLTFCFEVENTGEMTLDDVVIRDPMLGANDIPVADSLAPGEIGLAQMNYNYDASRIMTNRATALADVDGAPAITDMLSNLDDAVMVPPCAKVRVQVFEDINNNSLLDENNAGVAGVEVNLLQDGNVIQTVVSDDTGLVVFDELLSGSYTVDVDRGTIPGEYPSVPEAVTRFTVTNGPCECVDYLVPLVPAPTAIRLASFTFERELDTFHLAWSTEWEGDVLGYHLLNPNGDLVNDGLLLAGAKDYRVPLVGVQSGVYRLQTVGSDLSTAEVGQLELQEARPVGGETKHLAVMDSVLNFTVEPGTSSVLITGVKENTIVVDERGTIYVGAIIEAEAERALYMSVPSGLKLRLQVE